jgi:hypothetical protein
MQPIRLTIKQWSTLSLANHPAGIGLRPSQWRSNSKLKKLGLIEQNPDCFNAWRITDKGRAVLEVIETGEVVMFNTK